jgi:hypothetical protein
MRSVLLVLAGLAAGCSDRPTTARFDPIRAESDRRTLANKARGADRARILTEQWLEDARDKGGKELKAVKSWRILAVEHVTVLDKDGRGEPGWDVRVLVDHSDDLGHPVSREYTFRYLSWPADGGDFCQFHGLAPS